MVNIPTLDMSSFPASEPRDTVDTENVEDVDASVEPSSTTIVNDDPSVIHNEDVEQDDVVILTEEEVNEAREHAVEYEQQEQEQHNDDSVTADTEGENQEGQEEQEAEEVADEVVDAHVEDDAAAEEEDQQVEEHSVDESERIDEGVAADDHGGIGGEEEVEEENDDGDAVGQVDEIEELEHKPDAIVDDSLGEEVEKEEVEERQEEEEIAEKEEKMDHMRDLDVDDDDEQFDHVQVEDDDDDMDLRHTAAELEREMRQMLENDLQDSVELSDEIGGQMHQLHKSFLEVQTSFQSELDSAHAARGSDDTDSTQKEIEKLRFELQLAEQHLHREIQINALVSRQKEEVETKFKSLMSDYESLKFERDDLQQALGRAKEYSDRQREMLDQERKNVGELRDMLDEVRAQHGGDLEALKNQHEMEKNDLVIQNRHNTEMLQRELNEQKSECAQARKKLVGLRANYKQDLNWMKQLKEQFTVLQEDRRKLRQEILLLRQKQ